MTTTMKTNATTARERIGFAALGYGKCAFYKAAGTYEFNGRTRTNWVEISEAEAMAQSDGAPFEDLSTF